MKRKFGQFYSWNIESESVAYKTCDKSFFEHNVTGVPTEICWFFDADLFSKGTRREIKLKFNDHDYVGYIEKQSDYSGRTRLLWNTQLGSKFNTFNSKETVLARFEKIDDFYEITFKFVEKHNDETGWLLSVDFQKNNVLTEFSTLKKIIWVQYDGIEIGDLVYFYNLNDEHIKVKCKVNNINIENFDKKDSDLNQFNDIHKNYMELEMISKFDSQLLSKNQLKKYGLCIQQNLTKISLKTQEYLNIVEYLLNAEELETDEHDGSYELLKTIINEYSKLEDLSFVNYKDLNLIYLMCIGTWRQKLPAKKKTIFNSNLPDDAKQRILNTLEKVWNNAEQFLYSNEEKNTPSIGMFGTGFFSFQGKTDDASSQNFIQMCIDIMDMTNEEEILLRCAKTLTAELKGMRAASASMILHCLKPFVFPILNGNMGYNNIFDYFGLQLTHLTDIQYYIDNVKIVKKFRDENFMIKNYRIFDLVRQRFGNMNNYRINEFINRLLNEYVHEKGKSFSDNPLGKYVRRTIPEILNQTNYFDPSQYLVTGSVGQGNWVTIPWIAIFNRSITTSAQRGIYIVYLMHKNGKKMYLTFNQGYTELRKTLDRKECSDYLKKNAETIASQIDSRGFKIGHDIDLGNELDERGNFYKDGVIFYKEYTKGNVPDDQILLEDLKKMCDIYKDYTDLIRKDKVQIDQKEKYKIKVKMNNVYDKNLILYGPPGTGKTYSTAIYAVAICDDLKLEDVKKMDYREVMIRYHKLVEEGCIAFTTFHQSYGYEDFIEGIKPVVDENNNIVYEIESGIFKKFCLSAKQNRIESTKEGSVWSIMLNGIGTSQIKKRCFDEGTIRLAWHQLPERITNDIVDLPLEQRESLINFQDNMQIGDIVVSVNSKTNIDGIGIVTGPYTYEQNESDLWLRKRNVKWLITDTNIDLSDFSLSHELNFQVVQQLDNISGEDLLALVDMEFVIENNKPYVFVIDEINRGNISKIFGELITLVEESKREGKEEQAAAILPYSKKLFSVPDNVYIIGTMNTADRSIALMDTALRRRFQFIEMMPDTEVLKEIGANKVGDLDICLMLEKMNERITYLYDREHTIGHAFFTKLAFKPDLETLKSIFEKSVIPLLQEYFYEDYQKIQLILGDNAKKDPDTRFILDENTQVESIFKGYVEDYIDIPEKKFTINKKAFSNIESYKQII